MRLTQLAVGVLLVGAVAAARRLVRDLAGPVDDWNQEEFDAYIRRLRRSMMIDRG